jgi:hypothetical protein
MESGLHRPFTLYRRVSGVIGVYHRAGEGAMGPFARFQSVDDEVGPHVVGDHLPSQAA